MPFEELLFLYIMLGFITSSIWRGEGGGGCSLQGSISMNLESTAGTKMYPDGMLVPTVILPFSDLCTVEFLL